MRVRSSSPEPVKGVTQSILLMGGSGFPLDHVLSDNVDEFTCKICSEFCEQPVVTLCENKHIFCLACLDEWFRNGDNAKCPTCQEQMKYGTDARYETLKEHSPVLSRVYEKVRVRCPMDDACDWIGSCSEITRHMTSTDAHKKKRRRRVRRVRRRQKRRREVIATQKKRRTTIPPMVYRNKR